MTLVEIVVSIALLSMVSLLIITVFVTSNRIIGNNAIMKRNGENAAAGIENKMADPISTPAPFSSGDISIVSQQAQNFVVSFNGADITTGGKLVSSNDINNENTYYYFIAD
jgi:hypothetical protein